MRLQEEMHSNVSRRCKVQMAFQYSLAVNYKKILQFYDTEKKLIITSQKKPFNKNGFF